MNVQTEADFQRTVLHLARITGWRVAHFRPAQTRDGRWLTPVAADGKGFPDLVLAREDVLFVELKADKGRLTDDQTIWLNRLEEAGAHVRVWRPKDWPDIETTLTRGIADAA